MPMVRFVTDPNALYGTLHMLAVAVPGQGHGVHQFVQLPLAGAGTGVGKALQHAMVGHRDDAGIDRVVAVVVAVFFAVQTQDVVQAKLGAQHGRHLPGYGAGVLWANQAQVLLGHAAEVSGVVEGAGQKAFVFPQPLRMAVFAKAVTFVLGHQLGTGQHVGSGPALCRQVVFGLPWGAVAFDAVGLTHGHGFVVQAVVQRLRKRQDVLDFYLIGKQHLCTDLHTAVRAAPVGGVEAELFPQNHFLQVHCAHALGAGLQQCGDFAAHALVAALVVSLAFLVFFALLLVLLEVAGDFHNHFAGVAVALDERIDHSAHLV